jgi:hypothetical protein
MKRVISFIILTVAVLLGTPFVSLAADVAPSIHQVERVDLNPHYVVVKFTLPVPNFYINGDDLGFAEALSKFLNDNPTYRIVTITPIWGLYGQNGTRQTAIVVVFSTYIQS